MKKCIRILSVVLIFGMLLAIPAHATTEVEPRGSSYFLAHSVFLHKTSSTTFQIWFDIDAVRTMDELGASRIHVYRSADGVTWSKARSYYKDNYSSSMIFPDTFSCGGYVTYTGAWSGYYYRATIVLYAKDSTGIGERTRYTEIIQM